jgi:hypothetical protein
VSEYFAQGESGERESLYETDEASERWVREQLPGRGVRRLAHGPANLEPAGLHSDSKVVVTSNV